MHAFSFEIGRSADPRRRLVMKPARFLGHQIHPMLVVFPLGLLATSLIFDGIYCITEKPVFAETAYWNILAGLIGGLLAAVFGTWDWLTIPSKTRAKRVGALHGGINVVVVVLFIASWWLRRADALHHVPSSAALALSCIAILFATVSGWLGGELVERHGIGIAEDANLNAPSSLAPPARRTVRARPSGGMRRRTAP
jgi:uncharacterized membrane protein